MTSFPSYDEGDVAVWQAEDKSETTDSVKWNKVIELLGHFHERYSRGKVGPAHRGYDDMLDELMQAYDEWLD